MLNLFFSLKLKKSKLSVPKMKPIVIGTIYQPRSQSDFLENIKTHFSKLDTKNNEIKIHVYFNINLCLKWEHKKFLKNCELTSLVIILAQRTFISIIKLVFCLKHEFYFTIISKTAYH